MKIRDYKARETVLMRLAPWSDPQDVRNAFAKNLSEYIAKDNRLSAQSNRLAVQFIAGKKNVIRGCPVFRSILNRTIRNMYSDKVYTDHHFRESIAEYNNYFFSSDGALGI